MKEFSVGMQLNPTAGRQLGEEGLFVLWRPGAEPGTHQGLVCIASTCPDPDCTCEEVHVDAHPIPGHATEVHWDTSGLHVHGMTGPGGEPQDVDARLYAIVDPASGETTLHPDMEGDSDPSLLPWLTSELDGELLDVLYRVLARTKGYPPEGPLPDIRIGRLGERELVGVDELMDGVRPDEYVHADRTYWAGIFLCPIPKCVCHQALVVFFEETLEGDKDDDVIGDVMLDIDGPAGFTMVEMKAEAGPRSLVQELWTRFKQRHDVGALLRRRQEQLKEIGVKLFAPPASFRRTEPKVGPNEPCPCGSGRKHKKCCMAR